MRSEGEGYRLINIQINRYIFFFFAFTCPSCRRSCNSSRAAGASDRKAAAGVGQRLRRRVLRVPGLGPSARHYTLRSCLLPALHRPGHQHWAGSLKPFNCCCLKNVLATYQAATEERFPRTLLYKCSSCLQDKARCPLCRSEIKTSELVEFPQEEIQEESSANSERWRTSSKVRFPSTEAVQTNWWIKIAQTLCRPLKNAGYSFFAP